VRRRVRAAGSIEGWIRFSGERSTTCSLLPGAGWREALQSGLRRVLRGVPWAAFQGMGGELDVGGRAAGAALRHYVAGAAFALAALGGYAEFELDLVKAQACTGMAGNFAVRNSAADANDHGVAWLVIDSIGGVIINANPSHLQSCGGYFPGAGHLLRFSAVSSPLQLPPAAIAISLKSLGIKMAIYPGQTCTGSYKFSSKLLAGKAGDSARKCLAGCWVRPFSHGPHRCQAGEAGAKRQPTSATGCDSSPSAAPPPGSRPHPGLRAPGLSGAAR